MVNEWQDIASAPVDTLTYILAVDADGWMNVCRRFNGDLFYYAVTRGGKGLVFKPTYWMPLPPAPPAAGEETR